MATSSSHVGFGHQEFDNPTQLLSAEHRIIERVLAVVEKLSALPVEGSLGDWKKALEFVREFADKCHHLKEEKVLFPAMEEHGIPKEGGPIGMMLLEHDEGRGYVGSMFTAVERLEANDASAKESLLRNARAYLRLLKEHIQKEDEILFRMADEVIPREVQKQLLKTFEEYEAREMGTGVHEKYLAVAQDLEARVG